MSEQTELQLPYEDMTGNIVVQKELRQQYDRKDIEGYKIPFKDIEIWEGYNARTVFENIDELAENLYTRKQKTPFVLLVTKDKRHLLVQGERRYRAYKLLIEQGRFKEETEVPFKPIPSSTTMEELVIDLAESNNQNEPLKMFELATVAYRLKYLCGAEKSNEEVGKLMPIKKSRQVIDNLIKFATQATEDMKHQVREDKLSFTHAVELLNSKVKLQKQSDKAEEDSHKSAMFIQPDPKDILADELKELHDLQNTPTPEEEIESLSEEEKQLVIDIKKENDYKELIRVSDEIKANKKNLSNHIGKKLSADITAEWIEDFVDEDSGEVVSIPRTKVLEYKGRELTEEVAAQIVEEKVPYIFVYKKGMEPVAPSVITEPIAKKEKDKYDEDRPEMFAIQNAIKLNDWMNIALDKLDVPEGIKKDFTDRCKWQMTSLEEAREYIHKNKRQNKIR